MYHNVKRMKVKGIINFEIDVDIVTIDDQSPWEIANQQARRKFLLLSNSRENELGELRLGGLMVLPQEVEDV